MHIMYFSKCQNMAKHLLISTVHIQCQIAGLFIIPLHIS